METFVVQSLSSDLFLVTNRKRLFQITIACLSWQPTCILRCRASFSEIVSWDSPIYIFFLFEDDTWSETDENTRKKSYLLSSLTLLQEKKSWRSYLIKTEIKLECIISPWRYWKLSTKDFPLDSIRRSNLIVVKNNWRRIF